MKNYFDKIIMKLKDEIDIEKIQIVDNSFKLFKI